LIPPVARPFRFLDDVADVLFALKGSGMADIPIPIPIVTAEQMAAVDRAMSERLAIDLRQIMETAGQVVARFARSRMLAGDPVGKRVLVLCGTGGNGGDGFVAARVLHGWGADVTVMPVKPLAELDGVAAQQAEIVRRCGLPVLDSRPAGLPDADLMIDGLLGFSLRGAPRGAYAALIEAANRHPAPVLAIDLPSGLDGTTGEPFEPCIRADVTLTLGLPKQGLLKPQAATVIGALTLADVGIPLAAYRAAGLNVPPIFAREEWIDLPLER
jgi:NAD(P)H-hydrate epimerase